MNYRTRTNALPVVHWAAISSGALIGLSLSLVADALWSAAAFSSHTTAVYHHLAWWFGGTLIAATLIGSASSSALSVARGAVAGAVNGLTTGALVVLSTAAVAVAVAIAYGTTATVAVGSSEMPVSLGRPYIAFWASLVALVAGAIGGTAGGLVPRRDTTSPGSAVGAGRPSRLEATSNGSARIPTEVAAG